MQPRPLVPQTLALPQAQVSPMLALLVLVLLVLELLARASQVRPLLVRRPMVRPPLEDSKCRRHCHRMGSSHTKDSCMGMNNHLH